MSKRPPTSAGADERSPWSRPGVMLSGAFLLALVLLGAVLATVGGGSAGRAKASPAASAPAAAALTQRPRPTGACSLPAGSQQVPSGGPPAARWGTVGSVQVPQNPAVLGPQRQAGVWDTCFAHDPSGALLAAMNLWAEGTAVSPEQLFARLAVGAPKNLGSSAQLDSGGPVQFAGYRYVSYTPAQAQVQVVFQGPEGKLLAVVTTMVWSGGDWRYVFPAGGSPAMQAVSDLAGYVAWSAF